MPIKKLIFFQVLFLCCVGEVFAQQQNPDTARVQQKDMLDLLSKYIRFKKHSIPKEKKLYFSVLPLSGATANGNRFIVTSINATFLLGSIKNTNLSSIYFVPQTNFSSRIGFAVKPNIWLNKNKWNINGELRIIHNDVDTYGLGGGTTDEDENTISNQQVRVYMNLNRQVKGHFYVGIGYNFDYFYDIEESWSLPTTSAFKKYGIGTGPHSITNGFGPNFLFDNRPNPNNPISGFYSSLAFRLNPQFMGGTSSWGSIYFDNRKYISLSSNWHSVLAFWGVYWGSFGNVPYLDLPSTASDVSEKIGRGYSRWRYRGKQMLYAESEYRFDISANGFWGGVVFANAQSFTEPTTNRFAYILPAVGTGLRVKFNKKSNVNMVLDVAVGKDSFDWHLTLGEYF